MGSYAAHAVQPLHDCSCTGSASRRCSGWSCLGPARGARRVRRPAAAAARSLFIAVVSTIIPFGAFLTALHHIAPTNATVTSTRRAGDRGSRGVPAVRRGAHAAAAPRRRARDRGDRSSSSCPSGRPRRRCRLRTRAVSAESTAARVVYLLAVVRRLLAAASARARPGGGDDGTPAATGTAAEGDALAPGLPGAQHPRDAHRRAPAADRGRDAREPRARGRRDRGRAGRGRGAAPRTSARTSAPGTSGSRCTRISTRSEPIAPRDPNAEQANTEEFVGGVQTFDDYLLDQLALLDITDERARAPRRRSSARSTTTASSSARSTRSPRSPACLAEDGRGRARAPFSSSTRPVSARATSPRRSACRWSTSASTSRCSLRIIEEHLDDVAANHFRKIARALQVDEDEVRRLVEILRALNPRPAGAFSPGPSPGYIVPDVTLRRFDEEWLIISEQRGAAHAAGSARGTARCSRAARPPTTRRGATSRTRSARRRASSERRPAQGHGQPHHADHPRGAARLLRGRQGPAAAAAARGRRRRDRRAPLHGLARRHRQVHGHAVRPVRAEALLLRRLPHLDGHGRRRDEHQAAAARAASRTRTSPSRCRTRSSPSCSPTRASRSRGARSRSTARSSASSRPGRGAADDARSASGCRSATGRRPGPTDRRAAERRRYGHGRSRSSS